MNKSGCPVCGDPNITVLDDYGCTTFEICGSCNCEAGNHYDKLTTQEQLDALRKRWLDAPPRSQRWIGGRPDREEDDLELRRQKVEQLRKAGLANPE